MEQSFKRDKIAEATMELIAERGFHGSPISEIAVRAGVAAGTIYRYFENKDVLITELHQELEGNIRQVLEEGYSLQQSLRERFLYLIKTLFGYFVEHPLHFRYMEQYFNSPYGISLRRDMALGKNKREDIVLDIFTEGTRTGVLKDLPEKVFYSLAFGPMIVLLRDHILGFITLDDALIASIAEACWDGMER